MAKSSRQGMFPGMELGLAPEESAGAAVALDAPGGPDEASSTQTAPSDTSEVDNAATSSVAPATLAGQTVWVVDANSLIFQVFHALPEMTSPRGEPVSAVFGFTRDMLYLLEEKKPDYVFVAFDGKERTFRHEIFPQYKAQRTETPVDLAPQFAIIRRMLAGLRVPTLTLESYEADDLLATIAQRVNELEGECYLVSGDKDCRQLITDRVSVYNVRKDLVYDARALKKDWGVRPDQVVDFQALVGDAVDNVPGVPLVGPKIACEYLQKYDTLDELLARVDELPKGKRKENLIAWREQALLSRDLVRLDRHVPIPIDWEAARVDGFDNTALAGLFGELGFHTLEQKFSNLPERKPSVVWQADCQTINTPESLAWLVAQLREQPLLAVAVETSPGPPRWAQLLGCSFGFGAGQVFYVPLRASKPAASLAIDDALQTLRPIWEDAGIAKLGHDLKHAMVVLRAAGVRLAGAQFDTMVASYLLDAGERNHSLGELAQRYLKHRATTLEQLLGSGKSRKPIEELPPEDLARCAGEAVDVAWRLRPLLAEGLEAAGLERLFADLEMPLVTVLADLESNGIKVDVDLLAELGRKYGAIVDRLEREIHQLAGRAFNIGSPKQLQQILFDEHKLPVLKKTKSGGSTDADVLEELARVHPLPAKIIEYRQYAKLKNTYVDALPCLVHPDTGRVHASFNQVVAATGRLSSSEPNLQNIPVRSESGREIRAAFLPGEKGWKLLAADYSQIELRVLAHFSQDPELCAAFARDEDIHARVASQVYGVPLSGVTAEMRRGAKAVNFGVIYGLSPFGLAKQLGIEQAAAAAFIDAYFDRYRGVEEFLNRILEECPRSGYVSTILGRRRAIRGIRHDVSRQRNLSERTAINTVIQGSAADLIKLAMINIQQRLGNEALAARMLLQIHDELVFEVPAVELERVGNLVRHEMTSVMPLSVPLKVDMKTGDNWADCQEWN